MISYARIGILAGLFVAGLILGWTYEHRNLVVYKAEVEAVAKVQEAKNESIQKQQALVNKGIENEFQAKLGALRNRYDRVQYTSGSQLPSLSDSTGKPNGAPANLTLDCAVTTQQLVSLQDWIKEVTAIK